MQFTTEFHGEGFGLSYPSGINFNDFIGVSFGCTDENKKPCTSNCAACSSTCIIYNNDLVLTISPDIVNTKKTFFAQSTQPVSTFDSFNATRPFLLVFQPKNSHPSFVHETFNVGF